MLKLMTRDIRTVPGAAQPGRLAHAFKTLTIACALASTAGFPVACGWISNAPEARARDFIESLITQPRISGPGPDGTGNRALKPGAAALGERDATIPLGGLATRVTFEYLRAKHIQGTKFVFGYRGVQRPAKNERIVTIIVTVPQTTPNAPREADQRFQFHVRLRHEQQEWRVSGLETGDGGGASGLSQLFGLG